MEEVEHPTMKPDAPIITTYILSWATLTVSIEAKQPTTEAEAFMFLGDVVKMASQLQWGMPKVIIRKTLFCPKCKQESPLQKIVDFQANVKCPLCGANLKEAIEI